MDDWWWLIDHEAALREQFPDAASLIDERPGSKADRERQTRNHHDNHQSYRTGRTKWALARDADHRNKQEAEAFIRRMTHRHERRAS